MTTKCNHLGVKPQMEYSAAYSTMRELVPESTVRWQSHPLFSEIQPWEDPT